MITQLKKIEVPVSGPINIDKIQLTRKQKKDIANLPPYSYKFYRNKSHLSF